MKDPFNKHQIEHVNSQLNDLSSAKIVQGYFPYECFTHLMVHWMSRLMSTPRVRTEITFVGLFAQAPFTNTTLDAAHIYTHTHIQTCIPFTTPRLEGEHVKRIFCDKIFCFRFSSIVCVSARRRTCLYCWYSRLRSIRHRHHNTIFDIKLSTFNQIFEWDCKSSGTMFRKWMNFRIFIIFGFFFVCYFRLFALSIFLANQRIKMARMISW